MMSYFVGEIFISFTRDTMHVAQILANDLMPFGHSSSLCFERDITEVNVIMAQLNGAKLAVILGSKK